MNVISCKCIIFVHFVNDRQHKYIRTQKCVFCGQDTRYGRCIVILSYSYTGMESGDSRLIISTKTGSVSFEDSNLNDQTLQKWPQKQKQNERIIYSCTLYSLSHILKHSTLHHYLQPAHTTFLI